MSGGKIFSDVDNKCTMRRSPKGLHVSFACQDCESEIQMIHPWPEVKAMLQGQPVHGVTPTDAGWQIKVQCTEPNCVCQNAYEITADELEDQAQRELAHRQRRGMR
jgi:hypothetical protein